MHFSLPSIVSQNKVELPNNLPRCDDYFELDLVDERLFLISIGIDYTSAAERGESSSALWDTYDYTATAERGESFSRLRLAKDFWLNYNL